MAPTTNPNTAHTPPRHSSLPSLSLHSPFPSPSPSSTFTNCHHIVPVPLSPSLKLHHVLSMPGWLAASAALAAACQVACRRTKSSLTLQSLYIHGVPNVPSSPPPFLLSLSFSTHPFERYADPHIDRGANPLCRKGWCRRYDPYGARCK